MRTQFVEGLTNETRFLHALKEIERRGAPEASWLLVDGNPGYGKSNLLMRHAIRNRDARIAHVRAKADWTPKWALTDLADMLGVEPYRSTQDLEKAIIADLMEKQARKGFCIIVDEIDHAARNVRVLETLRDLTDTSECVLIIGGMKGVSNKLKAHPQIHSRIDQFVEFAPASLGDVKLMCAALCEVKVADDLAAEIHKRTFGRLRLVMGAIARVEAFGKAQRKPEVNLAGYAGRALISDERTLLSVVASS